MDEANIFVTDTDNKRIYVANVADLQFTELFSEEMEVWDFAFWQRRAEALLATEGKKAPMRSTSLTWTALTGTMVFNTGDGSKYVIVWLAWLQPDRPKVI